jgi:hypothetical protein
MTKRKSPYNKDLENFSPKIIDIYRRARKIYDDDSDPCQTVALGACSSECDELYALLERSDPWVVEVFTCIDIDRPPSWEKRVDDWHEAKSILTALERAAQA